MSAVTLLTESFHAVDGCKCRVGSFYRRGKHGLAYRIREFLRSQGVALTDPPHKPASSSTPARRPSLQLVAGGASLSAGFDETTDQED